MIDKIKSENMDTLFEAILCLESVEECYKFFDDFIFNFTKYEVWKNHILILKTI